MAVRRPAHPHGLYVLFFSEMWERFSFYGMRALLVLYLVDALDYPRGDALRVYATYTGLIYFTPLIGGYLADRWLGARRAVVAGGSLMAMGHFAMAFPSLLYPAMGLLIAGSGLFKPNISVLVGSLYGPGDTRRDSGFTLFYMGINLGAFLAPLVCGTLGQKIGWHYGFAAAGVGMVIGLTIFLMGWRGRRAQGARVLETQGLTNETTRFKYSDPLSASSMRREEWERIAAIFIMLVFVVFFWMGFEQAGGTMNLFADQRTERAIFGWEAPASYFQAINPLFILLLAPLFAALWARLDRSRWAISVVAKQALGMIILGLGFIVLAIADQRADVIGRVSVWWLVITYLFHTAGELCLSPIGLSMVTKLSPGRFISLMMGVWFTAMALANYLAGTLEGLLAGTGLRLYWFLVVTSIGAGTLLLMISPLVRRLMHGVR
jgi:POT family proton-dependent oligopeptide transporter